MVEAARLAKAGASKEEILEKIKYIRENTELFIGFSTLENYIVPSIVTDNGTIVMSSSRAIPGSIVMDESVTIFIGIFTI